MQDLRDALPRTPDEFLIWAEPQEEKHEYIEGSIVMQAGATRDHERVAKRIFASLFRQVDDSRFDVNKGDFGVRIKDGRGRGSILLPDVLVDLQSELGEERATTTPIVVIEVLSPSTDLRYHVEKLTKYARLPSVVHHAVFSQREPVVHLWRKTQDGWPAQPDIVRGLGAVIAFEDLGATLTLSDIYGRTQKT